MLSLRALWKGIRDVTFRTKWRWKYERPKVSPLVGTAPLPIQTLCLLAGHTPPGARPIQLLEIDILRHHLCRIQQSAAARDHVLALGS